MGRQSFTLKYTAIGGGVLLEIPRNHLDGVTNLGLSIKNQVLEVFRPYKCETFAEAYMKYLDPINANLS